MKEYKVENVINIIKDMDIKDKLRLGICLTTSNGANILYNKNEMYEKFDTMLKEIDEEYRTTLINFSKYELVMFTMAKIMEMEQTERNRHNFYCPRKNVNMVVSKRGKQKDMIAVKLNMRYIVQYIKFETISV